MAFEVKGGTVTLEFAEGTVLAGARVECSLDMSIRDFVRLQRMWAAADDGDLEKVEAAYSMFGDRALVSWDLTLGGVELPATGEGLVQLPVACANAIFAAWSDAVGGKSPNSSAASANGRT